MIAVARARLPPGRLGGERFGDRLPSAPRAGWQRARDRRKRRLKREEIAHRQARLVRLRELGPVAGDRSVQLEEPHVDQAERADGTDRLADRVEIDDRVALPAPRQRRIGVAAPEIDDRAAVDVDRERRAHLEARPERLGKGVAYGLEGPVALSVHDRAAVVHGWDTTIGVKRRLRKSADDAAATTCYSCSTRATRRRSRGPFAWSERAARRPQRGSLAFSSASCALMKARISSATSSNFVHCSL